MRIIQVQWRKVVLLTFFFLISAHVERAAEPALTKAQIKQFMLTAKVIASKHTKKGITDPWRLTLSDGTITHDAVFQAIDDHKNSFQFQDGHTELNFVDSYKYNIAGYELAELLGMGDMVPVHIERKWMGMIGSMSWVVPVKMDALERKDKNINAPDSSSWNDQMHKIRVFNELIYDTDSNLTNVLITEDWKIWRVDFSRAFRLHKTLREAKNLERCDRALFAKLKALNEAELTRKTIPFLTKPEIQGVVARRDKIVAYFEKLIAAKGENEILY